VFDRNAQVSMQFAGFERRPWRVNLLYQGWVIYLSSRAKDWILWSLPRPHVFSPNF